MRNYIVVVLCFLVVHKTSGVTIPKGFVKLPDEFQQKKADMVQPDDYLSFPPIDYGDQGIYYNENGKISDFQCAAPPTKGYF